MRALQRQEVPGERIALRKEPRSEVLSSLTPVLHRRCKRRKSPLVTAGKQRLTYNNLKATPGLGATSNPAKLCL